MRSKGGEGVNVRAGTAALTTSPMTAPGLKDLLEHVGLNEDDLKTRCSEEDLKEISLKITNWERYAPFLGLSGKDKENIANEKTKMLCTLLRWKEKYAFRATFGFLVEKVFMKNDDAESAEHVCWQLKGM